MYIILEALIALITVIALFSIVNSVLLEGVRRWTKERSKKLQQAIETLFTPDKDGDWNVAENFYKHQFIKKLTQAEGRKLPSWIPSDIFAETFIQMVVEKGNDNKEEASDTKSVIRDFENGLVSLPSDIREPCRQLLRYVKQNSDHQLDELRTRLMNWYESYMERVTDRFKRNTRVWLFYSGLGLAVWFNLDLIFLTYAFVERDELRLEYYQLGQQWTEDSVEINEEAITAWLGENIHKAEAEELFSTLLENVSVGPNGQKLASISESAKLPIGWKNPELKFFEGFGISSFEKWLWKVTGIIFMGGALSFGAPFWFDILRKATRLDRRIRIE